MSRFADVRPLHARLLLGLLLLLCLYGAWIPTSPQHALDPAADPTRSDYALYQAVAARVGEGESYYAAVTAEQRARKYPLRPIVTVRLPSLAWLIASLGSDLALNLLRLLALATVAAFTLRLRQVTQSRAVWAAATFLAAAGMTLLTVPAMAYWHESWAALLVALSLACRTPRRWGPSLCLGLLAVLFRELSFPYLALMALLAWREGSRKEALAWAGAMLVFFAALGAHAAALSAYVTDADPASPGWASAGGWPFVLAFVQRSTLFAFLPMPALALAVPLALLGWAGLKSGTGARAALLLLGYAAAFMGIGRADNFYWAIMLAPLLPIGLAFAPAALGDLLRSASRLRGSSLSPA